MNTQSILKFFGLSKYSELKAEKEKNKELDLTLHLLVDGLKQGKEFICKEDSYKAVDNEFIDNKIFYNTTLEVGSSNDVTVKNCTFLGYNS